MSEGEKSPENGGNGGKQDFSALLRALKRLGKFDEEDVLEKKPTVSDEDKAACVATVGKALREVSDMLISETKDAQEDMVMLQIGKGVATVRGLPPVPTVQTLIVVLMDEDVKIAEIAATFISSELAKRGVATLATYIFVAKDNAVFESFQQILKLQLNFPMEVGKDAVNDAVTMYMEPAVDYLVKYLRDLRNTLNNATAHMTMLRMLI